MTPINLAQKFSLFSEHWSPKVIGELNGQQVKLAKVKGEFVWHSHKDEDELFFIIEGKLRIEFRNRQVTLHPGEMLIIPKGVEHRPIAEEEVLLMLFEPIATKHTGEVRTAQTVDEYDWI